MLVARQSRTEQGATYLSDVSVELILNASESVAAPASRYHTRAPARLKQPAGRAWAPAVRSASG
jgi:hypothetical protein